MASVPTNDSHSELSNDKDQLGEPQPQISVLSPINNKIESNHCIKRPHEKFQSFFVSSSEEEGISPSKQPRITEKVNSKKKTGIETLQKGCEKARKYHRRLQGKLETCGQNMRLLRRLREKDNLISTLELRITELERNQNHYPKATNDKGESSPQDKENHHSDDHLPTATQKLLDQIQSLEKENEELRIKVSSIEASERKIKNGLGRWSLDLDRRSKSPFCYAEHRAKDLEYQLVQQDKKIQSLLSEKEALRNQLHETEVRYMEEVRLLQRKLNELQVQLLETEIECMNEQAKFTEHLANTPSMIVVESKRPAACSAEAVQCLLDKVQGLRLGQEFLRKQAGQVPQLLDTLVRSTALKIEEAIQTTDEKNKELVKKYTRELHLRKCYHNQLVELRGNIRVFCRVRPCVEDEGPKESVLEFDSFDDGVIMVSNKGRSQQFHLDKVFNMDVTQTQIFEEVSSLVRSAIDGFNVCIFAYGQTGSGKTYTMEGPTRDPGVNQRALQLLYEETQNSSWQYDIQASMLEIYNETLRDLLNSDPSTNRLEVKMKPEGGLHVPGLVTIPVKSLREVNRIFEAGRQNRATAATNMNERSSRSHCLLCVTVVGINVITGSKTYGRLNLVDLAGSERVSKSLADGARLKEAQSINKSLSALGDVISALKNKQAHIPYRNSKLTYLLQESLGGDSKTLMILQVSPVEKNVNESICTLTFGQRVRSAELGAASRKVEDGSKVPLYRLGQWREPQLRCTPSSARRANAETPKSPTSGAHTPSSRTPNLPKASTVPARLNLRFK